MKVHVTCTTVYHKQRLVNKTNFKDLVYITWHDIALSVCVFDHDKALALYPCMQAPGYEAR